MRMKTKQRCLLQASNLRCCAPLLVSNSSWLRSLAHYGALAEWLRGWTPRAQGPWGGCLFEVWSDPDQHPVLYSTKQHCATSASARANFLFLIECTDLNSFSLPVYQFFSYNLLPKREQYYLISGKPGQLQTSTHEIKAESLSQTQASIALEPHSNIWCPLSLVRIPKAYIVIKICLLFSMPS